MLRPEYQGQDPRRQCARKTYSKHGRHTSEKKTWTTSFRRRDNVKICLKWVGWTINRSVVISPAFKCDKGNL